MSIKLSYLTPVAWGLATLGSSLGWSQQPVYADFYQQFISVSPASDRQDIAPANYQQNVLDRLTQQNLRNHTAGLSRRQADNLVFNTLWLEQYEEGYQSKQGGAALGKLFRMGIKTLYFSQSQPKVRNSASSNNNDEIVTSHGDLDYHFRLTEENVSLAVEYGF